MNSMARFRKWVAHKCGMARRKLARTCKAVLGIRKVESSPTSSGFSFPASDVAVDRSALNTESIFKGTGQSTFADEALAFSCGRLSEGAKAQRHCELLDTCPIPISDTSSNNLSSSKPEPTRSLSTNIRFESKNCTVCLGDGKRGCDHYYGSYFDTLSRIHDLKDHVFGDQCEKCNSNDTLSQSISSMIHQMLSQVESIFLNEAQGDCLDYAGRYFATLRVLQATNERVNLAAYDENVGLIDERPVLNRLRKLFAQVKAVFNSMEHIPEILQEYDPI